ncbi:hypothetical protein Tco_0307834 [Tanacetum coccineum]
MSSSSSKPRKPTVTNIGGIPIEFPFQPNIHSSSKPQHKPRHAKKTGRLNEGLSHSKLLPLGGMESSFDMARFTGVTTPGEANNCNRKLPASPPQSGLHDEHVLLPACLTQQGHSESAPHPSIPLSSTLQECSSHEDPSFRSSFCLPLVGLRPES